MNKKSVNLVKYENLVNEFGFQRVQYCIDKLNDKEKKVVYMSLGISGYEKKTNSQINQILKTSNSILIVKRALNDIEKNLISPKESSNDILFDMLVSKYGENKVVDIVKRKGKSAQKIICLYFGLEGYPKKSYTEINEMYKLNSSKEIVTKTLEYVEEVLDNHFIIKGRRTNHEKYQTLVELYGEDEVKNVIKELDDKCQKIINLYYGFDGDSPKSLKEINGILNITDSNKFIYHAFKQIESKIKNKKINKTEYKKRNIELLYNYLNNNDRSAYEELMLNNQGLIEACIKKRVNISYMSEEEKIKEFLSVGFIGLHKAINSINKEMLDTINFQLYSSEYICKEILEELRKCYNYKDLSIDDKSLRLDCIAIQKDSIEEFIEKDYVEYIKNRALDILDRVGNKAKLIIQKYYGLNGEAEMTREEISQKYNISLGYISKTITSTNHYLKKVISKELRINYNRKIDVNR